MQRQGRLAAAEYRCRRLVPTDREEIQIMHEQWFPIRYPDQFFIMATSLHSRLQSEILVDPYRNEIVALAVWRQCLLSHCDVEDRDILPPIADPTAQPIAQEVIYILTIGVAVDHRKRGLASRLLRQLLAHACANSNRNCWCVYLHVLSTNQPAIQFYESHGFVQHKLIPGYYEIAGEKRDAYTYVFFITPKPPPDLKDIVVQTYRDVCWDTSCTVM
eukprot:m.30183 g.30183  ORF g.30183 m.30183 type:complete len:217 (+) comp12201_c0_seq1:206-856(+)